MDLGLRDRTAVVCASTSGLGLAIVRALANEGAAVVVCGRRGDLAVEIAESLPRAIGVAIDLTDPRAPVLLAEAAKERFGDVDILVLNSGGPSPGLAADLNPDDLEAANALLLYPMQRMIREFLPAMRERKWGRILAVGSSGIREPLAGLALSNASRSALSGLLKTLASEVASDGVTVNMLLPGRIATQRVASLDELRAKQEGRPVEEVERESKDRIPMHRYGRPEEFGAVAAFLCSEATSYMTGAHVLVDGGLVRTA